MPSHSIRIGVLDIGLPIDTDNPLPSLATVTPALSSISSDDILLNDVNNPLLTTDTYQVILGLVGRDDTNKGYSVGVCSPATGVGSITAGQVLKVTASVSALTDVYESVCMAVFLKINSANYQLAGFRYIDDQDTTFVAVIDSKPLRASPKFTAALLQSSTADNILGDRAPLGTTYETVDPTTGDTTENMPVVNVNVPINSGADFNIRTTVSEGISFQLLVNTIKEFVRSIGGNYVKYTHGGVQYEQANTMLNTAKAVIRGNKAIKLTFPPDVSGFQETKLLVGNLTFNQNELTAAWSKSNVTPVNFVFSPASLDRLITNQHTSISYIRKV